MLVLALLAVVLVVYLRVSVIEAAPTVVVLARHDCVDRFWVVAGGNAFGLVDVVSKSRVKPHAVDRGVASADSHDVTRGVDELVPLPEVVAVRGLVEHVGDVAVKRRRAEGVVRWFVSVPSSSDNVDELGLAVRFRHIVERAGVIRIQGTRGAVRSDAWVASSTKNIARALSGCNRKRNKERKHPANLQRKERGAGISMWALRPCTLEAPTAQTYDEDAHCSLNARRARTRHAERT